MLETGSLDVLGLGSTGLLIYLVVKEALSYGKGKKNGKTAGEMDPSFWELKFNQIAKEETKAIATAMVEQHNDINDKMDRILRKQEDMNYALAQIITSKIQRKSEEE
jgi:hypothetical protein